MSWALWITGPPGSGKTTLARGAAAGLEAIGEPVVLLELDAIRKLLTPTPTYSSAERELVYRALVFMAVALAETGRPVIVDATGHRRAWRELARRSIPQFAEVQLVCPLEVCRARERARAPGEAPRGIYDAAGRPGATGPGVDVPYEPARDPELEIGTATTSRRIAIAAIVGLGRQLSRRAPARWSREEGGWALWITGPPGSGKTALAWSVAERLALHGVPVRVLAFADLARSILACGEPGALAEEILYRALAGTAALLAATGMPVIIDGTAARRQWRELARERIPRFAEVLLVCPAEICRQRERAERWRLTFTDYGAGDRPLPTRHDPGLDYEPPLRADLVVRTDLVSLWAATQDIARLAERLHWTTMASAGPN